MQILQQRFEGGEVETRRAVFADTEIAPRDLAAKGRALEIEEARCCRGGLTLSERQTMSGQTASY